MFRPLLGISSGFTCHIPLHHVTQSVEGGRPSSFNPLSWQTAMAMMCGPWKQLCLAKFPVLLTVLYGYVLRFWFSITQSPHFLHDYMKHTYANPHSGFSPNCESPKPCPTFWCLKIGYNPLSHLFPAKMAILRPFGEVPQFQSQPFSKPGVTIPFFTRYMKLPGPSSLITFPWL